jgi:hypothetical protein
MAYWGAIISAVGSLLGGAMSSNGADNAADSQRQAAQQGIDEQRREWDQMRHDLAPYMDAGTGALSGLQKLMRGDYSGFENSPDYLYAKQQMTQGLDRSAAARGRLYSGGYGVDLSGHLNGLASQNLGTYRNFLAGLAHEGQASAAGVGAAGMSMANSIGQLYGNMGDAGAYGAMGSANAWANALNGASRSIGDVWNTSRSSYGGGGSDASAWGGGQQPSTGWGGLPDYYYGGNR